ncbi:MAG: hypothetical protein HZA91_08685 [Verrucomicrobia bacterium]|nr:hypothetical protein [Verrucomicrobiota bacterium]
MSDEGSQRIVRFRHGPRVWLVAPGERRFLFSQAKPGQIRQAPMTRVKQSRAKVVYRMKMEGAQGPRTIYLKSYLTGNYFWRQLKYAFRASPAMEEWRLARRLSARGVPIAPHLAVGETRFLRTLQEATLVTEGLSGWETISDFLAGHGGGRTRAVAPGLRQAFARELGKFVRLLHDRGVLQVDLHGSNILMRVMGGRPEFRLVDLDGIIVHRLVPRSERFANLVTLHIYFTLCSSRADRLRFLRAYLGDDKASRLPKLSRRIESVAARAVKFYHRERAQRCLKNNRDFGLLKGAGLVWRARRDPFNTEAEVVIENPNRLLTQPRVLIKDSPSSTVGHYMGFIIKRTNPKKLLNWIKDLLRPSRAHEAYLKAYQLELCEIPTPTAVAYADWRSFGFLRHSYLVTVEVAGASALDQFVKANPALPLAARRDLSRRLARLVASLHDAGFSHRDMKAQNILVGPAPERKLYLIDLDGLNDAGELPAGRALKDLARLDRSARELLGSSPRERLRFFAEYRRALRDRRLRAALTQ